jgi:hypothetical protein
VNANTPKLQLFRNRMGEFPDLAQNTRIGVRLVGGNWTSEAARGWSPRDALGARVTVRCGEREFVREWRSGEGMGAQNGTTLWIGLGSVETVDAITVRWPSGRTTELTNLKPDRLVTVWENAEQGPKGRPVRVVRYQREVETAAKPTHPTTSYEPSIAKGETARLRVYTSMATHCAACRRELPNMAALRASFATDEVAFFGIPHDLSEPRERLEAYVVDNQPGYVLHLDATEAERNAFVSIAMAETRTDLRPSTVVTDAVGTVLLVTAGPPTRSALRELLAQH